jgi:hypothetical protein
VVNEGGSVCELGRFHPRFSFGWLVHAALGSVGSWRCTVLHTAHALNTRARSPTQSRSPPHGPPLASSWRLLYVVGDEKQMGGETVADR